MDMNNENYGEDLHLLARGKGLRKLRGETDYDDWVFTAQGKLEKLSVWSVISTPRQMSMQMSFCFAFNE